MRFLLAFGTTAWATLAVAGAIAPTSINLPTLDEVGLIALAVLVGIAGGVIARRRK